MDQRVDPHTLYAHLRATEPVRFNEAMQAWDVYRYADIQTVFGSPQDFSSDVLSKPTLQSMDPPRHTQLRRLVARAFSHKLISALEPRIQAITDELLDQVQANGRMDAVADLAFLLPVRVIAELLGLPVEDRDMFRAWAVSAVKLVELEFQGLPADPTLAAAVDDLEAYLATMAADRLASPREDLVSGLVHAEIDGERLSHDEIISTCRLVLIAGFETTATLIGNLVQLVLSHPDARALVQQDPANLESAVDEALRLNTPFTFFARRATRDVVLGGQSIKAGQLVLVHLASGNRDETVFEEPDQFRVTRNPNRHLSFGHGIHYCLGAHLGRMEARIAVGSLLQKFPNAALTEGAERTASVVLNGWSKLPVTF
jgi:cytochrome P450